jgi:hypothetical protein
MSNIKVVNFNKEPQTDADKVLTNAVGHLASVVLLGVGKDGTLYFSSNTFEKRNLLYQIEQLKFDLLAGIFDEDFDEDF